MSLPTPIRAYRITQWEGSHETHESRKLKFLPWVAAPNKHDGLGFSYLKAEPEQEKIELYCAWKLMVDLAARAHQSQRGWLMRSGKALSAADLAMMTTFPQRIFERAFEFFCRPEVGWLEEQDVPPETFELPLSAPKTPANPATPGQTPADSPGTPAGPAATVAGTAAILPTDRQGVQGVQDSSGREREREAGAGSSDGLEMTLEQSKQRWGALNVRNQALRAKGRDKWTAEERAEFQKNAATKKAIEKKQRAGGFK